MHGLIAYKLFCWNISAFNFINDVWTTSSCGQPLTTALYAAPLGITQYDYQLLEGRNQCVPLAKLNCFPWLWSGIADGGEIRLSYWGGVQHEMRRNCRFTRAPDPWKQNMACLGTLALDLLKPPKPRLEIPHWINAFRVFRPYCKRKIFRRHFGRCKPCMCHVTCCTLFSFENHLGTLLKAASILKTKVGSTFWTKMSALISRLVFLIILVRICCCWA